MCPHPVIMIQSNPANQIQPIQPIQSISSDIQRYNPANTIQPANTIRSDFSTQQQSQPRPIFGCFTASASSYTTYPDDAPSSDFPPSPAASSARHLLSSSAAASSAAFFASNLDGAVFLAFLIASPTGQSLEEIRKCFMKPHRHCFYWLLIVSSFASSMLMRLVWNCMPWL